MCPLSVTALAVALCVAPAVPITFICFSQSLSPLVMIKLIFGIPMLLYDTMKMALLLFCPWCPKIKIQPERGFAPYDPNPY